MKPHGLERTRPSNAAKCLAALAWSCWVSGAVFAQTCRVTLTIDASRPGPAIPADFLGLSISSMSIDGNSGYQRCFTPANAQMVHLFRQIGIKHLRTIMGKAKPGFPDPTPAQIDAFFDFAAAAGVQKIIWSLHLYNAGATPTNWSNNKAVAAHIWNTTTARGTVERNLLESFAFDNEPDWLRYICCADPVITGYATPAHQGYIDKWKQWCQAISAADVAPEARFSGPDTGSAWPAETNRKVVNTSIGGVPFTLRFVTDAQARLSLASQHFYGESSVGLEAEQMAEHCLSRYWVTNDYPALANRALAGAPGWPQGRHGAPMPYRFTECSAFNNGHGNRANHSFATALWALDFYHWWVRAGCAGVDPFTRTAQYNSPIYFDGTNYVAEPHAYAMKAFSLGGRGRVLGPDQVVMSNPGQLNLTAYGVVSPKALYLTLINKTFNAVGARTARVSIPAPKGFNPARARYIVLSAGPTPGASGDASVEGACLGGAEIPNDGSSWAGAWTNLPVSEGKVQLPVLPATAVVVELGN